jgi:hypothetical protein
MMSPLRTAYLIGPIQREAEIKALTEQIATYSGR